jgi:hypothetical protein
MADRVMFISWGSPVHGREQRALEVFNEARAMIRTTISSIGPMLGMRVLLFDSSRVRRDRWMSRYATTRNGRIIELDSCSRMWQW